MAVGKSIKMYLTIFLATTCIYMILYQYHISVHSMSSAADMIKKKESLPDADDSQRGDRILTNYVATSIPVLSSYSSSSPSSSLSSLQSAQSLSPSTLQTSSPIMSRYNIFLWSPLNFLTKSKSLRFAYRISKNGTAKLRGHDKKLARLKQSNSNSTFPYDDTTINDEPDLKIFLTSTRSPSASSSAQRTNGQQQQGEFHVETADDGVNLVKTKFDNLLALTSYAMSAATVASTTIVSPTAASTVNSLGNELQPLSLAAPILEAQHSDQQSMFGAHNEKPRIQAAGASSSSFASAFALSSALRIIDSSNQTVNATTPRKIQMTERTITKSSIITAAKTTTTTTSTATSTTSITRTSRTNDNPVKRTATKIVMNGFMTKPEPPPLYIITPTYRRAEQLAELTRLGYTLKHVVNLLWLVIEDANTTSSLVTKTLNRIGVPYEYLIAPMPEEYKKTKKAKPRGVSNRNRGLAWLRQNATDGVFYFADDDNTYDISIFEQMRYTQKVSMWPVGLVTKYGVSSPIIRNGQIVGFYDGWIGGRKYPVDMAGFAVSVKFLHERPDAKMPFKPGYEEDGFLKSLSPLKNSEIELLAANCTEILTWHTQTKKNGPAEPLNQTKYGDTNLVSIDKMLVRP